MAQYYYKIWWVSGGFCTDKFYIYINILCVATSKGTCIQRQYILDVASMNDRPKIDLFEHLGVVILVDRCPDRHTFRAIFGDLESSPSLE